MPIPIAMAALAASDAPELRASRDFLRRFFTTFLRVRFDALGSYVFFCVTFFFGLGLGVFFAFFVFDFFGVDFFFGAGSSLRTASRVSGGLGLIVGALIMKGNAGK